MADDRSSHELLAHFDRPRVVEFDDFDWDEDAEAADRGIIVGNQFTIRRALAEERPRSVQGVQSRGVGWVLKCAGVMAVFAIAGCVLGDFAIVIAAQNTLDAAARAGAMEATLPRATYQSIAETIERRLSSYPQVYSELQINVLQNGAAVGSRLRIAQGDRIAISLSMHKSAFLPNWLRQMSSWRSAGTITARAEQDVPGKRLRPN